MIVTINTDASFWNGKNKGSFAYWIVSNQGRMQKYGVLKGATADPTEAEMKCIVNAVFDLLKNSGWSGISKIIINTDSMNSIHMLSKNKPAITKYRLQSKKKRLCALIMLFDQLIQRNKVSVELRHVRSHQSTDTPKQWVNEWCDQNAKKALRDFLNKEIKTLRGKFRK